MNAHMPCRLSARLRIPCLVTFPSFIQTNRLFRHIRGICHGVVESKSARAVEENDADIGFFP